MGAGVVEAAGAGVLGDPLSLILPQSVAVLSDAGLGLAHPR